MSLTCLKKLMHFLINALHLTDLRVLKLQKTSCQFRKCVSGKYLKKLVMVLTLSFVTEEYYYMDVLNFLFRRNEFYFAGWKHFFIFSNYLKKTFKNFSQIFPKTVRSLSSSMYLFSNVSKVNIQENPLLYCYMRNSACRWRIVKILYIYIYI